MRAFQRLLPGATCALLFTVGCVDNAAGSDAGTNAVDAAVPVDAGGVMDAGRDAGSTIPDAGPLPPDAPLVDGETSAGHLDVSWTWNVPARATSFRFSVNAGAEQSVPSTTTGYTLQRPSPGAVTLSIRACNSAGACSAATTFTTVVEFLGGDKLPPWTGVARTLPVTPLGKSVGVSCHNCYAGPGNAVLSVSDVNAKIDGALGHGADLIELDVVEIGGVIHASHDVVATADGRPTLQQVLDNPALSASDAMLFLEVKGSTVDAAGFAQLLLNVLEANRGYVHNGRPVFLRGFREMVPHLLALQGALTQRPLLRPYVRFHVLYWDNVGSSPAEVVSILSTEVLAHGFHGVEVNHLSPFLTQFAAFASQHDLLMGTWTLPGGFGELYTAALRDDVDQLTGEFRADQLRRAVVEENVAGAFNLGRAPVLADKVVVDRVVPSPLTEQRALNVAETPQQHGTPGWVDSVASAWGQELVFTAATHTALPLWDVNADPQQGFLLQASVRFDNLNLPDGVTSTILGKADGHSGVALELAGAGGVTSLRFVVGDGMGLSVHEYPVGGVSLPAAGVCGGADAPQFSVPLEAGRTYRVVGAFDGNGGVYLFINGRCAATARPELTLGVPANSLPFLVGASPIPAAPFATSFFDGAVQSATVLRWGDHSFTGSNIN
jgi:hypothetical protein